MSDAFAELLEQATKKIHKYHPDAALCGALQQGYYEDSPWTFTFRVAGKQGQLDSTSELMYALGQFTLPPEDRNEPPLGVRDIPLPLRHGLDAAERALRLHGVHDVITRIELTFPRFPGVTQPHYAFEVNNGIWYVGSRDNVVRESPVSATEPALALT